MQGKAPSFARAGPVGDGEVNLAFHAMTQRTPGAKDPGPTVDPLPDARARVRRRAVIRSCGIVLEEPGEPVEVGAGLDEADDGDEGLGVDQGRRTAHS